MRIFLQLLILLQFIILHFTQAQSDHSTNQKIQELDPLTGSIFDYHSSINNWPKFDSLNSIFTKSDYNISSQIFEGANGITYKQTPWQWLQPSTSGFDLRDIYVFNENVIIAVGGAGTIMKTTNGGNTWDLSNSRIWNSELSAITFITDEIGFICGYNGTVLKTTDQGETWNKLSFPNTESLIGICFLNESIGFVVGLHNLSATYDGGITWIDRNIFNFFPQSAFKEMTSCDFINPDNGYATGYYIGQSNLFIPIVLKTSDSGLNWNIVYTDTLGDNSNYEKVLIKENSEIVVIGDDLGPIPFLLKSTDNGITWNKNLLPSGIGLPKDICFSENGVGVIAGFWKIISSTDNGLTWQYNQLDDYTPLTSCFIAQDDSTLNFYSSGWGGLILKKDNIQGNWFKITSGLYEDLTDIHFFNSAFGVTASYFGDFFVTNDGGISWENISNASSCYSLFFLDESVGYLTGSGGAIKKTTNSGLTWINQNSGVGSTLYDIMFNDDLNGFCVGKNGIILKTTDGGNNWSIKNQNGNENYTLFEACFIDSNKGFAVGGDFSNIISQKDILLKTTDSGNTWDSVFTISYGWLDHQGLSAVFFVDSLTGFIAGNGHRILKTIDGGLSWYTTFENGPRITDIYFIDRNVGYASGNVSSILKTTDGGESWNPDFPQSGSVVFNRIYFIKNGDGFVGYAIGITGQVLCCAISPLNSKTWTWTGTEDSSWNNANNWNPSGVPLPGDSVIIPYSQQHPVIYKTQQQIVIASLDLQSGGWLTITDSLKRFVVLGDVKINGTLEIRDSANTSIVVGGGWIIDQDFIPGKSTVYFIGEGVMKGNFFNSVLDSNSTMNSAGNLLIDGRLTALSNMTSGGTDTLFIQNKSPQSLIGPGKILGGTIKRNLLQNSIEHYQFESENTFLKFDGTGTYPEFVSVTTYPDTTPTSFGTDWIEVPSTVDPVNNVVTADSITDFSRWSIRIPRRTGNYVMVPDSFIHRVYEISAEGGSDFKARLSLRYDQSEVPAGVIEDSLRLFKLNETTNTNDEEVIIPTVMTLYQNFPNPFNSSTKIRYDIPERGQVSLILYDVLGSEVKKLLNKELEIGHYEAEFDGSDLSSGVYFYKLSLNSNSLNHSITKKLVLLQ